MTCVEKFREDHPEWTELELGYHISKECPSEHKYLADQRDCCEGVNCFECWHREIPEPIILSADDKTKLNECISKACSLNPETIVWPKENPYISETAKNAMKKYREELKESIETEPRILDSGDRTEFSSGAVRDLREGKGRCDLMPLDVVSEYFNYRDPDNILINIYSFQRTGDRRLLDTALSHFAEKRGWDEHTMFLEVAIHFEEGAKKYGDSNWQKGIPVRCYIDSAVRHYLKFLRGDKDEPHDRAFCWNLLCAIWTCKHKPELNDYRKEEN